jgi:hypothetical protein
MPTERSWRRCTYIISKSPTYRRGFPTTDDHADRTAGTSLSPLPYQAWYGYYVTIGHQGEVNVCAGGLASAPPSGAAAYESPRAPFFDNTKTDL